MRHVANRTWLEYLRINAFGRFYRTTLGPFSEGLNIVYGANEAGKSTVSAFVKGVLFGWEDARGRGVKNTYKPAELERSGTLIFHNSAVDEPLELTRVRNADGLSFAGQDAEDIVADIDKDTFATVFAINSESLQGLNRTAEVTSHLLTAGSGTQVSPAEALDELDARIAGYTSRAASADRSLARVKDRLEENRLAMAEARKVADALKAQDCELAELEADRALLNEQLAAANAEVERLTAAEASLVHIDGRIAQAQESLDRLASEKILLAGEGRSYADVPPVQEVGKTRARVFELMEQRAAAQAKVQHAQERFEDASSAYVEAKGAKTYQGAALERRRATRKTVVQAAVAVVCAAAAVAFALLWSRHGETLPLVMAAITAAAALGCAVAAALSAQAVFGGRPADGGQGRMDEAYQRLDQERSKLMAATEALDRFDADVAEELNAMGLEGAYGSLQQAQFMVEGSYQVERQRESYDRRVALHQESLEQVAEALTAERARRAEVLADVGLSDDATLAEVDAALVAAAAQRDGIAAALDESALRYGELKERLAAGAGDTALEELKIQRAQLNCLYEDLAGDLARDLIARRMLVQAVRIWERESQPEVYARASELMALMTDGAWTGVHMGQGGTLTVSDAAGVRREPHLLSLGTRQQLYLALRIALLECAGNVGASVPVLADDILVHFDDARRTGAIKALEELSRTRQVILFTCHKEIVSAVRSQAARSTLIEL